MTDSDPQLHPEKEGAVRRLLAEARATEQMPVDVAERLDDVVADLDAGRGADMPGSPVIPLDARRRRRRAAALVLAAAVVVVAGVGIGQLIRGADESGDTLTTDSAGTSESPPAAEERAGAPTAMQDEELDGDLAGEPESLGAPLALPQDLPIGRASRERFADDVRRLRGALPDRYPPPTYAFRRLDTGALPARLVSPRTRLTCGAAHWGDGVLVPVVFDGQAAVLAFRPPTGDTQVVDVVQCGSGDTLHSTTLTIR